MSSSPAASEKRLPVIGLMIGSFHTDYSRSLCLDICHALNGQAEVCLYQGFDAERFLCLNDFVAGSFDWHYYSVFDYAKFMRPDLLMISFGTVSGIRDAVALEPFLAALPKVPLLLIEDDRPVENGCFVTVDNYAGMRACVEHLLCEHGCREVLFVSGPPEVHDAALRRRAYEDAMRSHGLRVSEDMIAYGDFTDMIHGEVEALLARHPKPDAIVCANDEMAECVYRVLHAHGLRPGLDVAVTGFDDNRASAYLDPALTTVRQNHHQLAEAASAMALAILRGEQPSSVYLTADLICRGSCGCPEPPRSAEAEALETEYLTDVRENRKRFVHENMLSPMLLRRLLREKMSVHGFFRDLGQSLRQLFIPRARVALLREPIEVEPGKRFFLPDELLLHMVLDGDTLLTFSRKEAPVLHSGTPEASLLAEYNSGEPVSVYPLFYGNLHYGVLIAEVPEAEWLFCYTLSLEIGTGLRYLYLALETQAAHEALEEKNHILDFSATHDTLTGLYNRAGIMNEIYSYVRSFDGERRFTVVMADLDHLKQINDSFGHSAGDTAIRNAARLLSLALPLGSPLGRIGGDEFLAVFPLGEGVDAESLRSSLRQLCHVCDEQECLPFYLGVSVGCASFSARDITLLPQLIRQADQDLYESKKQRRPSVIRL